MFKNSKISLVREMQPHVAEEEGACVGQEGERATI
jgi:hypothetical protein